MMIGHRIADWPTLAFTVATVLTVTNSYAEAPETLPFETAVAEMARAPLERVYDGTVEAVNQATMSAQTAGRIAEVFFDVDDYVEPGEPIVRFTDVEQQSALRQAKAALEEALARRCTDTLQRDVFPAVWTCVEPGMPLRGRVHDVDGVVIGLTHLSTIRTFN